MWKMLSSKYLLAGLITYPLWEYLADGFKTNYELILIVGVFVFLDGVSGVYAAYRSGVANSKTFFEKFLDKFAAYMFILILSFGLFVLAQSQGYKAENFEFVITYPMGVLLVREFWSIGENINKIQPGLFDKIKEVYLKILKK